MSCSCQIDMDFDDYEGVFWETYPKAKKEHTCCECLTKINKGTKYENTRTLHDGYFSRCKTCMDCVSMRGALFCTWIYGQIWHDLRDQFYDNPSLPSAECMMQMTKVARDKVCDLLEECWGEDND